MSTKEFLIASIETQDKEYEGKQYKSYTIKTGSGSVAYANVGKWNSDWKVGMTVKATVEEKKSAKGGKYFKLGCPPELRPQYGGSGNDEIKRMFQEIQLQLNRIELKMDPKLPLSDESFPDFSTQDNVENEDAELPF